MLNMELNERRKTFKKGLTFMRLNKKDALRIPVLDIARIVVPQFVDKGKFSTGQCCRHEDNKLGNLRFKEGKNYAHCFTCGESFDPISMVTEFRNLDFQEALEFLHDYFPNYFTTDIEYHNSWTGLSNKDYSYLGIQSQVMLGEESMDIRTFAKKFPKDHDVLLVSKIIKMKENMEIIKDHLLMRKFDESKIEKDEKKINEKLFQLFNSGIFSSDFKIKGLDPDNFNLVLKELLSEEI